MREIKFRAWDKHNKCFVNPNKIAINLNGIPFALDETWLKHNLADLILSQYINVKDKNGIKIWQGDLVKYDKVIGEVYEQVGYWTATNLGNEFSVFEVIGNIYESPELLIQDTKEGE